MMRKLWEKIEGWHYYCTHSLAWWCRCKACGGEHKKVATAFKLTLNTRNNMLSNIMTNIFRMKFNFCCFCAVLRGISLFLTPMSLLAWYCVWELKGGEIYIKCFKEINFLPCSPSASLMFFAIVFRVRSSAWWMLVCKSHLLKIIERNIQHEHQQWEHWKERMKTGLRNMEMCSRQRVQKYTKKSLQL